MKLVKAMTLSTAIFAATALAASAQETASAPPTYQPQATTNPGFGYSSSRAAGPSVGHSTWVPSNPSPAGATASSGIRNDEGNFYSKKGFGPAPN